MLQGLITKIGGDWSKVENFVEKIKVQPKTILLREGQISKNIYFIRQGALRMWFNKDGKDITFQFFFEGKAVASIESFLNNTPSLFTIESIEQTEVLVISKKNFKTILQLYPLLKEELLMCCQSDFKIIHICFYLELKTLRKRDTRNLQLFIPTSSKEFPNIILPRIWG